MDLPTEVQIPIYRYLTDYNQIYTSTEPVTLKAWVDLSPWWVTVKIPELTDERIAELRQVEHQGDKPCRE